MADTQRSRSALLTLFADNVTGQISPQDLRDFQVTVMEPEFVNAGDFWKKPDPQQISSDRTGRGSKLYSQLVDDTCSFAAILMQNASGVWSKAVFGGSVNSITRIAMALASVGTASTETTLLEEGIIKFSLNSGLWSGKIGVPFFVLSGTAGSMTATRQSALLMIGWPEVEASDFTISYTDVFRFSPRWPAIAE